MLARSHARIADQARRAIGKNFRQRPGVFMRNDTRYGPGGGRMLGRKRNPTLKKGTGAIALYRALPASRILYCFDHHQAVQSGFAGKETRLPPVRIVILVTENP